MPPKKRRQYGTGSVYQRKDGRWIAAVQAGWNPNGTMRRITVSAATEADVKKRLRAKLREIERHGLPTVGVQGRATVRTFAEPWLEQTQLKLRPKAWSTDSSAVRTWIVPILGSKRLSTLTPGDVRSVADAIRRAGRSSSTALRCHVVLTKMLKAAAVEGHPIPPQVLMVARPTKAVSDRDAVPLDDVMAMLKVADGQPDGSRWAAAFIQGMRQGECLGLTWPCVDLERGTMDVSWQLQAIPFKHGCGAAQGSVWPCGRKRAGACPERRLRVPEGYEARQLDGALCLVRPKTERGQRIIPLVPYMAAMLTAWRQVCPASPHGLVWPAVDGRPRTDKADREAWHQLQTAAEVHAAGRPYELHEARHATATRLLELGTDPKIVTAIMGHSSITTSRGYQHVSQRLTREALEGVAQRLQLPGSA